MAFVVGVGKIGRDSWKYLFFVACFWLLGYAGAFWRRAHIGNSMVPVANFGLLTLLALVSFRSWRHRIKVIDVLFYIILVVAYFLNTVFYPRIADFVYSYAPEVLLVTFPFFFVGLMFKYEGNERWITWLSRFAVVFNLMYIYISSGDTEASSDETMNRAYLLLPSVLYLTWRSIEHLNLIDLTFFIVGFFIEMSFGSRGPFVCILFFAAIYLFFFKEYKSKILVRILIVAITGFLYIGASVFAEFMITLLKMFGRSSRIFELMLDDALINYEESNGRNTIQEWMFRKLNTDSFGTGFGLFADRIETGFYAHNIFVELWFAHGYLWGSIIIVCFLILLMMFFINTKNTNARIIAILFFTVSFFKLQFSGSFITEEYLFFLIGFCINGLRESKDNIRVNLEKRF